MPDLLEDPYGKWLVCIKKAVVLMNLAILDQLYILAHILPLVTAAVKATAEKGEPTVGSLIWKSTPVNPKPSAQPGSKVPEAYEFAC